ncbi:Dual specificity tyrosine-phosphorylation-regulated kinase 1A [Sparganum proliferum]
MSGISNVSTCAASLGLRPGQLLTAVPTTGGLGEVEIIGKKLPAEISTMDPKKLQSLTVSEPKKMPDCSSCLKFAGDVEAHSESSLYPPTGIVTGAAIYGQLVTADQLSQLEQQGGLTGGSACNTGSQGLLHRSPSQKSQQHQALRSKLAALNAAVMTTAAAAAAVTGTTTTVAVATTMPSPLTGSVCSSNSSVAAAAAAVATTTTTSHLPPPSPSTVAAMSLSAYAKLDPSYSLKNCAVGAKASQQPHHQQQQPQVHICHRPVAYHHPMDVVGDSEKARPTAMEVVVGSGQPDSPSSNSSVNKSVNNTYSYPIFPYATVTTVEAGSSTAFVGHVKDSCEGLLMAPAVAPSLQPHQQQQASRAAEAMAAAAPPPPPTHFPRRPSQQRVLVKMSVKLIQTYENINEVYFRKKRRRDQAGEDNLLKRDRKGPTCTTSVAACGAVIDPAVGQHQQQQQQQQQQHPHSAFPFSQPHHVHCLSCCSASAAGSGTVATSSICQHSCCSNHRCLGAAATCPQHSQAAAAASGHSCLLQPAPPRQVTLGNGANSSAAAVRTAHLPPGQPVLQHVYDVGTTKTAISRTNAPMATLPSASVAVAPATTVRHPSVTCSHTDFLRIGDVLLDRYEITAQTGKGTFGQVVRAMDLLTGEEVAIKVIKNKRSFIQQAQIEIKLLREIARFQGEEEVAAEVGANYVGVHRRQAIQDDAFGECWSLCDSSVVREKGVICAPEVLLNLDYSLGIDMWSLGCILVEMHTGEPLFSGSNELEQLLKIVEVFGLPPCRMLEASPKLENFFERVTPGESLVAAGGQSESPASGGTSSVFAKAVITVRGIVYRPRRYWTKGGATTKCQFLGVHSRPLREVVGRETGGPSGRRINEDGHSPEDYDKFIDLVQQMLIYDPRHRIRPDEALAHRFFERKNSEGQTVTPSAPAVVAAAAAAAAAAASATVPGKPVALSSEPGTTAAVPPQPPPAVLRETHFPCPAADDSTGPSYLAFAPNQEPPGSFAPTPSTTTTASAPVKHSSATHVEALKQQQQQQQQQH